MQPHTAPDRGIGNTDLFWNRADVGEQGKAVQDPSVVPSETMHAEVARQSETKKRNLVYKFA